MHARVRLYFGRSYTLWPDTIVFDVYQVFRNTELFVVVVVVFPPGTPFIGGRDSRPAMSLQCFRERCTVKPTVIEGQIYSWVRPLDTTFNLR